MPKVRTSDGVELHYEEAGSGPPLVFVHELAGDCRSFAPQLRHFARAFRCIAFNARGYPPSDVPADLAAYSQARAVEDIKEVLDGLEIDKAHLVGVSMGGSAVLHFGLQYSTRVLSLVVAAAGSGAAPEQQAMFRDEAEAMAALIERKGMAAGATLIAHGRTRLPYRTKDPRGFATFVARLAGHSVVGTAATLRGVQKARPSLCDAVARLQAMSLPILVIVGDEDDACLNAALFLSRTIPTAGLAVLPRTGHNLNLEEPALFNTLCQDFLFRVIASR